MDKDTVSAKLRELATSDNKRSKAARLMDVIADVEAALAAGVTQAAVVETLKGCGLDMSLATFETTLRRIRAKRGKPAPLTTRPAAAGLDIPPDHPGTDATPVAHTPGELDRIIQGQPDLRALSRIAKAQK